MLQYYDLKNNVKCMCKTAEKLKIIYNKRVA